jgi:MFS family permease
VTTVVQLPRRRRPASRLGPLDELQFRRLWLGQAVSAFGDGIAPVALAFAVIELNGSASALGLVFVAMLVPRLTLVLPGGVWADRLPRQRVMLAADAVRCLTQGLIAVALVTGTARLWQLVALSALYGAADAFFSPAVTGLVPETVRPDRLQQANALLGLTRSATLALGPAVGGALVATAGPGWAFAADSATFAVSAWFLARLRLPGTPWPERRSRFRDDLRAGWREVTARTWVWASIAYFAVSNLAFAAVFVLGPFVADESLGGAESWGLIVSCGGVGSVLGGLVALRLRPRRPLMVGFLAMALCALEPTLLARPASAAAIAVAAALGLGAIAFGNALWFTALQERIPREAISRVSSYDWLGTIAFKPVGYALVGPLVAALGMSSTLTLAAAVLAASSLAIAAVPGVRRLTR